MSYISVAEADTFLIDSSEWSAASVTEKEYAILLSSKWIDGEYTCTVSVPVQDEVQYANAYLADMYVKGTLFSPSGGAVKSVLVKAGPVTVEEEYSDSEQAEDAFAEIRLLLSSTTCTLKTTFEVIRV